MKQFKVISYTAIVYALPDLNSAQLDHLPLGLFVDGEIHGQWVAIPLVGYVLKSHLEVL